MKQENNILKWFDNELSQKEINDLKQSDNLKTLEKIAHYSSQLEAPKVDAQKALEDFKSRNLSKKETKVLPLNFKSFLKIAAVFLVMLTSSYFLFFNNTKSYSTEFAQTKTLTLPDNSEVILNAQSQLAFNKKDWKNSRNLTLDGEAFFKVSKGEKFTVTTDAGIVQVLGTQFNVKERDNYFEVQCYEGSVSVTSSQEKVVLTPGKSFRVVNGEVSLGSDFNAENPSWLAKESSFNNVPLWQVINELEIQYNLKIDATQVNTSVTFSGSFTHTDKNIALQAVTIPLKISYKINGKNVEFYNYDTK
ncbi:FecR family protein [Algibacter luteus]|uniref:FecR family protein n=1 Tax=Algibacter luteus TaxID=1178825 RepID=UPI00259914B8|nr:FecR family protein [Algibacter luteus]WJJ97641.1 FecR family protein [Algibacter luteus]